MASVTERGPGVESIGPAALDHDDLTWLNLVRAGHFGEAECDPSITLADWLDVQAAAILAKGRGSAPSNWLGRQVADLAAMARRLKADTVEALEARMEVEDEARITTAWSEGWDACERRRESQRALALGFEPGEYGL